VDVSKRTVSPRDTIHVGITIANTGDSDGDEVLQVYVRYVSQSDRDPLKSLKAFARVHLKQGKEQHVRIPLATMDLKQYDEAIDDYAVKPGSYEILIGASSSDIRLTTRIQVNE
jgi:beta-glucosidase